MNWIGSLTRKLSLETNKKSESESESASQSESNTNTATTDADTATNNSTSIDPCTGCNIPCTEHIQYPPGIIKSIDRGSMSNSVKPYRRHIIIATDSNTDSSNWPNEVTDIKNSYIQEFDNQLKQNKSAIGYKIKLTLTDQPLINNNNTSNSSTAEEYADIYIFPDLLLFPSVPRNSIKYLIQKLLIEDLGEIKYKSINKKSTTTNTTNTANTVDTDNTTTDSASTINNNQSDSNFLINNISLPHSRLTGLWLLVCCHKLRDKRCGVTGPILIDEIQDYSFKHQLTTDIHTLKISHIGGHKYAGNVIVYPSGYWYGRVETCHIANIIEAHRNNNNNNNTILDKLNGLVRGRIDLQW